MTDIVERLRNQLEYWNSGGRFEAAGEIERLRAQHQEALDFWGKAMDERDRLRNLQHERSDSRAWLTVGALEAKNVRLMREIERFRIGIDGVMCALVDPDIPDADTRISNAIAAIRGLK